MKPEIESTSFGSITIDGTTYDHDVIIRLSGEVKKRKKKLSKAIFGTSHTVSLDEAEHIYEDEARRIIIGTGQYGIVKLSKEAKAYFEKKGCTCELLPTPKAVQAWNEAHDQAIAMFHVTC